MVNKMASNIDVIFDFISKHPDCTSRDVTDALGYPRSTVTARISDLVQRGRIIITGKKTKNKIVMRKYRASDVEVTVPQNTNYPKMDKKLLNILKSVDSWEDERLTSILTVDEDSPHISRFKGNGYDLILYRYTSYPHVRLMLDYYTKGIKMDMITSVRSIPSHMTISISNQHSSLEVRTK